jgi:hypothetical protein
MRKTMSIIRSDLVVPLLAILAVLLAAIAIIQPWWSVRTSPELQLMTNSTLNIDAGLFQTLTATSTDTGAGTTNTTMFAITNKTAYQDPIFRTIMVDRIDGNITTTFTFNVSNMTSYQQQTQQIHDTTKQTLPLMVIGLVLTIVTMLLTVLITRTGMALEKYTYLAGVLAVMILLIAPLELAYSVASFSGSLAITDRASVWNRETVAMWGPSTGWYLAIAAALIIIVYLLPVRVMYSDRKLRTQTQIRNI